MKANCAHNSTQVTQPSPVWCTPPPPHLMQLLRCLDPGGQCEAQHPLAPVLQRQVQVSAQLHHQQAPGTEEGLGGAVADRGKAHRDLAEDADLQ